MRILISVGLLLLALVLPVQAQSEDAPWQAAITGQIEAFRSGDGAAALELAGAGFKSQFSDPELFVKAIAASGYGPIVESRSHSFGDFNRVGDTIVLQVVKFVGPDQSLYEALYQMMDETDVGWRVQGVALKKEQGVAI